MRESERPGKVIEYLMLAGNVFLGLVVLELIVHGLVDYADATFLFQTQKKPVLALLCLFMTAFLLLVFSVCRRLTENLTLRKAKMVSALLLVPAFALQIYMLFYYRSSYLFDNAFVTGGASALAMDGQVAKEAVYYLSVYPNQNAYAVLTAVLWKLGTAAGISRASMPLLLNCVNLVFLDTAAVLFLLTVCAYKKQTPGGFVRILFLLLCNPFLYIGVSYYYTITLSMPFVMGILYLYVRFLRKKEKHPYVVLALLGLRVSAARNDNDPIYCCDRLSAVFGAAAETGSSGSGSCCFDYCGDQRGKPPIYRAGYQRHSFSADTLGHDVHDFAGQS